MVDLQVNGFGGFDLKGDDLSVEVVVGLRGVVGEARRRYAEVREAIPFVHLEGPRISGQDGPRGCHDAAFVRPPDIKEFERCQRDGLIGHTHADTAQIRAAVDAGARLSTHLGHGAHAQLPRHPTYLWAQLADDRLTAGFIAVGHHLPVETFVAMVRAKGLDRSFLVSDSVAVGGRLPGSYESAVGGEVELTEDGRLLVRDTPYLAGAAASLNDGVAWAPAAFSLPEALTMATGEAQAVLSMVSPRIAAMASSSSGSSLTPDAAAESASGPKREPPTRSRAVAAPTRSTTAPATARHPPRAV
ncbi:hypothetical protein ACWCOV_24320 [Kribbella sp. NPDC002412]